MPKKAKKRAKIVVQSNSDDDDDTFKKSKKKGRKIALSDSSDDNDIKVPKASTSKGKTCFQNPSMLIASAISQIFWPYYVFFVT